VEYVYGEKAAHFDTLPVRPLSHYVKVDYNLYGCPMDKREFIEVIRSALLGKKPNIPNYPVCNECRMAENICVFERGLTCFGPVSRAGCGAICPAHGTGCCGCRGLVDKPFIESHRRILMEHGMDMDDILSQFREFNGYWEETHEKP
ncbi:MAG TPA: NADH:ubiquinone oxidoreductase, partial [Nitrospirota bacterium]|nr:NADH:ubiquinone oxidoreductase [Nitrospirota bacterium]